jgi:UDPglucose--hexose-1-phosphate uridylyltransferase
LCNYSLVTHRTSGTLADGREIFFFDRKPVDRDIADARDLPPISTSSELRHDPLLDEWVTMASHRQGRTHLPPADQCPLCPSRAGRLSEIPADDYDVVVFENRFPSLALASAERSASADAPANVLATGAVPDPAARFVPHQGSALVPRRPGHGRCEVVCFTSDHDASFAELSVESARLVVDAWIDRTRELSALPSVKQVFCFENRGREIGVTLSHPHGQICAYPFVTPRTDRMLTVAKRHADRTGRNLFADVLAEERVDGSRIVLASDLWTAFVPAAARWPVEVHLYPNRHVPDLPSLTETECDDLVRQYLGVLRRLDALYDMPLPYIAAWHQAPVHGDRDLAYLHLQVFSTRRAPDKLKYLAGSESAMGAFITDVLPEDVAARLREVA